MNVSDHVIVNRPPPHLTIFFLNEFFHIFFSRQNEFSDQTRLKSSIYLHKQIGQFEQKRLFGQNWTILDIWTILTILDNFRPRPIEVKYIVEVN